MASTNLSKTPSSAGNRRKFNFSFWIKGTSYISKYIFFSNSGSTESTLLFDANSRFEYYEYNGSSKTTKVTTKRNFKDAGAWYHIVVSVDTTQSTDSNRVKIYVNGTQETDLENTTYGAQNFDSLFNNTTTQYIGSNASGGYFDGAMTHIHFNDGYNYDPSSFGETDSTSGIWKPKTSPSVTYGTNGYFLKFENSGAMGTDSSGNSNTYAVSGTLTQIVDTPNNNFAVLNPLPSQEFLSSAFYEYGGTNCRSSTANFIAGVSQFYLDKGKWYFEMQTATADAHIGIAGENKIQNGGSTGGVNNRLFYYEDSTGYAYSYNGPNGMIYFSTPSDGTQTASYGNTFSSSDTLGCFVDLDNNKLYFSKNGTIQNSGTGYSIQDDILYAFGTSVYQSNSSLNYGNGSFKGVKLTGTTYSDANGFGIFKYSPNQGGASNFDSSAKNFYALCTKNIKDFG